MKVQLLKETFLKSIFFLFAFFFFIQVKGEIRLPAILSDNMVLQQQSSVKLWGWGDPTEKVFITNSWNNQTDSTMVDQNAKWILHIQTPAAGGPFTITIKGNNTIVLKNILIGEVWVCSGQSNMEMSYNWGIPQMKDELAIAHNAAIRFFTIPKSTAKYPQENGMGTWLESDSNSAKSFSAVAYYFGKKLNADLNVPIGLINASWGGTPAEAWTPAEIVNNDPVLNAAVQKLQPTKGWPVIPGYAFNSMIAPLTNFHIAGTIWYQGESNTGTAASYQKLFTSMINAWRKNWQNDFPFYFVQLAPFNYGNNQVGALLREAQTKTLVLPKTAMAVITDLADDTTDIHPKNKRDVGYRLASLALKEHYDKPVTAYKSPAFKSMVKDKSKIHLYFDDQVKSFKINGKEAIGFLIAGADKIFYPAQVKFNDNSMVVWHKKIKDPVAVRYAFSNTAQGNVFNEAGLPLAPFRTDDWDEVITR